MFQDVRNIENDSTDPITVWLEPWAIDYTLMPRDVLRIVGNSKQDGRFEVVNYGDKIGVYGWPGSSFQIFLNEKFIDEQSAFADDGPPSGASIREFIERAFGGPGGTGD